MHDGSGTRQRWHLNSWGTISTGDPGDLQQEFIRRQMQRGAVYKIYIVHLPSFISGHKGAWAHPFWHVPPIWVVVMILQNHHGGDNWQADDDHYTGKVLTWWKAESCVRVYCHFTHTVMKWQPLWPKTVVKLNVLHYCSVKRQGQRERLILLVQAEM